MQRKQLHEHRVDVVHKLAHALAISISINKPDLIKLIKKTIIDYEATVSEDSKPGLWGFSFDQLVANKKVILEENEEKDIIDDLENRLSRVKNGNPWLCEHVAERLAKYYRLKGKDEEAKRVITDLGSTFEKAAASATPLQASSWLEHMLQVYIQFNLKSEAENLSKSIQAIGPKVHEDMETISHKIDIPRAELEEYIKQQIQETMEKSLALIAVRNIPKKGEIQEQLSTLAKSAPISFLFSKHITDHSGRIVAKIGSLDEDMDGNIIHQMTQNMGLLAIFLNAVLNRVIEHHKITGKQLVDYLLHSPVFNEQQRKFLHEGIEAYLNSQFTHAIHLLVPQIEVAIRCLLELSGGSIIKPSRNGGFNLKTLGELLSSEEIVLVLGEDVAFYLRTLLTDQRGLNIRNDVCHGILRYEMMSNTIADRLIHVLLTLALIQDNKPKA